MQKCAQLRIGGAHCINDREKFARLIVKQNQHLEIFSITLALSKFFGVDYNTASSYLAEPRVNKSIRKSAVEISAARCDRF